MKFFSFIFTISYIAFFSCTDPRPTTPDWEYPKNYYSSKLENAIFLLDSLLHTHNQRDQAIEIFTLARYDFKVAESYAANLNPEVGHRVNGPPLPVFREDNSKILPPVGLQSIEESLYDGEYNPNKISYQIDITLGYLRNLHGNVKDREVTPHRYFIAAHHQLLRIIALSLAGFDTPVSLLSLKEAAISLESFFEVYDHTFGGLIESRNNSLHSIFDIQIKNAVTYLNQNQDFNDFNRYKFIREYMNPITRSWVNIRNESGLWEPIDYKAINFEAPTFFEKNSFHLIHFMSNTNRNINEEKITLGKRLFFDQNLSKEGNLSCASCHIPEKGYSDGLRTGIDNSGNPLKRNTPTLINSVFQKRLFWDGRSPTLEAQISEVFSNNKEFNIGFHQLNTEFLKDTTYKQAFKTLYGRENFKNSDIAKAISSFVATLYSFNSKFDKNLRGEESTFTDLEVKGFNLFMSKGLCATCHFIPLTNGTVPPFFTETELEVIGVPESAANQMIDDDLGFYRFFEVEIHRGMFKTPTVRNIEVTAPYMHNGVYDSLEQVMDFYNKGGGGGMGFGFPDQTLPFDSLSLSLDEQNALITFMKTLTDDTVPSDY